MLRTADRSRIHVRSATDSRSASGIRPIVGIGSPSLLSGTGVTLIESITCGPDSLPKHAPARQEFFQTFSDVSLKTLGLQLSDDTVAKVSGRVARSFDDAVRHLASNILRLRNEFRGEQDDADDVELQDDDTDSAAASKQKV